MKKTVSAILPVIVLVIAFGAFMCFGGMGTASADNNRCGENLTWTLDENGTLTVSGSGEMEDYSAGDPAPWYQYTNDITAAVIDSGVTSIGKCAFLECGEIKSVTIAESVTDIGIGAFSDCSSLTSVTIPDSVTSIGDYAFYKCSSMTDVTIPKNVTSIGKAAFSRCYAFTSIMLPDSVTNIDDHTFSFCMALESITIPDSVASIGDSAFSFCTALASVTIPESVTSIGDDAFIYCDKLRDVYYAGSEAQWNAITIGANNDSLTSANIHNTRGSCGENLTWTLDETGTLTISGSGEMYDYDNYGDHAAPWNEFRDSITNVVIDSGVTSIGAYAFYDCIGVTDITIPDGVTSIGEWAFSGCESLASVTIPDSVTSIGEGTFSDCSTLESITLPESVTSIGNYAFSYCIALTSAVIPDGVTSIGYSAFSFCTALENVVLPESITSIGEDAFDFISNLRDVYYAGSEAQWNAIVIRPDDGPLSSAAMHFDSESLPTVNNNGSCGENLTWTLDETGTLTISGNGEMYNYNADNHAPWYEDIYKITNVVIDSGVTSIGDFAFSFCEYLESVTIPDSVTNIGSYAFSGCNALDSVTIPDSVTSIGDGAFAYCALERVTIPEGVTEISDCTFYNCGSMTDITIPASVTSIGSGAFIYCYELNDVYYAGSEAQWNAIVIRPDNAPLSSAAMYFDGESLPSVNTGNSCGGNLTWTLDDTGTLTISGNGKMHDYDRAMDHPAPWYEDRDNITNVIIDSGVMRIGNDAFSNCESLESVTIPDSVTNIGSYAFSGCSALASVTIPDSVTSIGDGAFYYCDKLRDVYFTGSEAQWNAITVGADNELLTGAKIHFDAA